MAKFRVPKLSVMHVLLLVMVLAAVIRVADIRLAPNVAQAEDKPKTGEVVPLPDQKAITETPEKSLPLAAPDDVNEAESALLEQLSDRRRTLDKREQDLMQREALLKAAQAELKDKYAELDGLRQEIKRLLDQQSEAEESRLRSLVKVYEGMKPAEAAGILNTIDITILMQVMGRMSERKLSPILASMDPERAREVTIRLARQKKLPDAPAASPPQ